MLDGSYGWSLAHTKCTTSKRFTGRWTCTACGGCKHLSYSCGVTGGLLKCVPIFLSKGPEGSSRSLLGNIWRTCLIACQAPLSMEFARQEYWSGLPFPSPGDFPDLGVKSRSPSSQADSLPSEPSGHPWTQQRSVQWLTEELETKAFQFGPLFLPPCGVTVHAWDSVFKTKSITRLIHLRLMNKTS